MIYFFTFTIVLSGIVQLSVRPSGVKDIYSSVIA